MDTILVTAVGNIGAGSQIVECLALAEKEDYYIVGTDISSNHINCIDKLNAFYVIPRADDKDYGVIIERIIKKHQVSLVFVGSINEAIWFYKNMESLRLKKIKVVLGSEWLFNLCMEKDSLFEYLQKRVECVPKYKKISTISDCEDIDFFPVVLKPNRYAIASNHVYVVFDKEELYLLSKYTLMNNIEMIAQEWKGDSTQEYSIGVTMDYDGKLCGSIAIKRDLSSSIAKKSVYLYKGKKYIISSGITQGEVVLDTNLLNQAQIIAKSLNAVGPLNLQAIWDSGRLWIIDAHPAITGGSFARALAGYNEPLFWTAFLLHDYTIPLNAKRMKISRVLKTEVEADEDAGNNITT